MELNPLILINYLQTTYQLVGWSPFTFN